MTTRTFEKINDIFNCKLLLEDGTEFTIPLREDGYIHATQLCKAAGKRIYDWLRLKETKELQNNIQLSVEKSVSPNLASQKLIEVYKGNTSKYTQGTWIHPDLGLNLAQWCSPSFSVQVSKWLRELIFTGNVELEKEKSYEEIESKYQKLISDLQDKLNVTEDKLNVTEDLVKLYDEESKELHKKYDKMHINHQAYLRHKELYKLKEGPCVYLIDMKQNYGSEIFRYKIGQTGDITNRVSGFRTANPFCKILCVLYTFKNLELEKTMKTRYEENLLPNNSEFISGVDIETLMDDLQQTAIWLKCKYTMETEEEINKFNRHIISVDEVEEINDEAITKKDDGTLTKRCGGLHHDGEENRQQPLTNFFKNKGNSSGYARLCKECYLTGVYGDKRKKRKQVVIPKFDTTTQKWCNLCESIKEHKDFYADKIKKDGLNANCKACKNNQKKQKQKQKKNNVVVGEVVIPEEEKGVEIVVNLEKNPLERYTKDELRQVGRDKNLRVPYRLTKPQLIDMLTE